MWDLVVDDVAADHGVDGWDVQDRGVLGVAATNVEERDVAPDTEPRPLGANTEKAG
jgi:hypothetical protein